MKNIKFYLLASLLAFVLIAGQPHATVASVNSSTQVQVDLFDGTAAEFSVNIFNMTDGATGPVIEKQAGEDAVYEFVSDAFFPQARLFVNVSGYTMIANSTGHEHAYVGALYLILNGEVSSVGGSYVGASGIDIPVTEEANVITFLYIGRDDNNDLVYAQDTVIVLVADSADGFADYGYEDINVDVDLTNEAVGNSAQVNTTGLLAYNAFSAYTRDTLFTPSIDANFTAVIDGEEVDLAENYNYQDVLSTDLGQVSVTGTWDGSGFHGQQAKGYNYTGLYHDGGESVHDRTNGHAFLIHAQGVTLIDSDTVTGQLGFLRTADNAGASPLGILALADYGYWDAEQDVYGAGADWDGLYGGFYGSVDFVHNSDGLIFQANGPILSTSTETPGFGVVVSLFSVGLIAYIAPRMRKD